MDITCRCLPCKTFSRYHSAMSIQRYPIEERWSPAVASKGFSAVPTVFLNSYAQLGITPTEAMLIIHLMSYKWDNRRPFPSVAKLCAKLGLSDGQVRSILRRLEKEKKFVTRIHRIGRSNEFDFTPLIHALEQLQEQEALELQESPSEDPMAGWSEEPPF